MASACETAWNVEWELGCQHEWGSAVDLELSEDQELFRDTTRQFLLDQVPLTTIREWADLPAGYSSDWWRKGAELGWTSLLVGEAHGGGSISGNGLSDLTLVAEEMGALVSPGPLGPVNVVAEAVSREGTSEQVETVLPGLLTGDQVAAWCVAEPSTATGLDGVTLTAEPKASGFVLNGVKVPVEAGAEADWLLVTAASSQGPTQFVIPASTPGVVVTPLRGLDLVRRHAKIDFTDVRVSRSALLGDEGAARSAIDLQLRTALILQCAETVGATERVFEFTVQYAFDRYSFGRSLASYQALKHRFADMKLWLESALAITVDAAKADDDATEMAAIAKAYVADRCPEIIQDCVQMHGGIGVTWDHDIHLYLRRATLHRQIYGQPAEHRDRVADLIGSSN
jgi:alkylation response protein AidB-like acyl-CoA dehydrogenase